MNHLGPDRGGAGVGPGNEWLGPGTALLESGDGGVGPGRLVEVSIAAAAARRRRLQPIRACTHKIAIVRRSRLMSALPPKADK